MILIRLVQGDTGDHSRGRRARQFRATYMGGTAIFRASEEIVAKGRPIAASMLEAAEADIHFADGSYQLPAPTGAWACWMSRRKLGTGARRSTPTISGRGNT